MYRVLQIYILVTVEFSAIVTAQKYGAILQSLQLGSKYTYIQGVPHFRCTVNKYFRPSMENVNSWTREWITRQKSKVSRHVKKKADVFSRSRKRFHNTVCRHCRPFARLVRLQVLLHDNWSVYAVAGLNTSNEHYISVMCWDCLSRVDSARWCSNKRLLWEVVAKLNPNPPSRHASQWSTPLGR